MSYGLGQAAGGSVLSRFTQTAASIWGGAAAAPVAYAQLVEYAKITAVGTFVGIPLAMVVGYFAGKRRRVRSAGPRWSSPPLVPVANRGRRRRRR